VGVREPLTVHISQTLLITLGSIAYFLFGCWCGYPILSFLSMDHPSRDTWWFEILLFIVGVFFCVPAIVVLILTRIITFPWSRS
jgi:hypothetical protein